MRSRVRERWRFRWDTGLPEGTNLYLIRALTHGSLLHKDSPKAFPPQRAALILAAREGDGRRRLRCRPSLSTGTLKDAMKYTELEQPAFAPSRGIEGVGASAFGMKPDE